MMINSTLFSEGMGRVERWPGLLADLGRSGATIKARRGVLAHYLRDCDARSVLPETARFEDFSAWIRPQLPGMACPGASATLQLRISAVRLWYEFLCYEGLCEASPVPRTAQQGAVFSDRGLVPDSPAFRMTGNGRPFWRWPITAPCGARK